MGSPELYDQLCSYDNLELAFQKARKRKTFKQYVIDFEECLHQNLLKLRNELLFQTYKPQPLKTFILHDPKKRKISKSHFRDRVIHHALCNIIEPSFDKVFIRGSFANRLGKGTLNAIKRFDSFKERVSKNNKKTCYVLKADIKQYFDTVNHGILLSLIQKRVKDKRILWLVATILANHKTKEAGIGMPLGNLTSQFFANIYLHELDRFVKHRLKAKHYIRYVDDFVILHQSKNQLRQCKEKINNFLNVHLTLTLHPAKSTILTLSKGVGFLGFRIFFHHHLLRKKNMNRFERRFNQLSKSYKEEKVDREKVVERFEGWLAYAAHANTYKYRLYFIRKFNQAFPLQKNEAVTNVKKHMNFGEKLAGGGANTFSSQQTLFLLNKGLNIKEIARKRDIKEGTVWQHISQLIEYNQLSIWKLFPHYKIKKILLRVKNEQDKLKDIKNRINDPNITFDEIHCVLAHVRKNHKPKNIIKLVNWYKHTNYYRKCYANPKQRKTCAQKFDQLIQHNPTMEMQKKAFLYLFNNHINICVLSEKEKRCYITKKAFLKKLKQTKKKKK